MRSPSDPLCLDCDEGSRSIVRAENSHSATPDADPVLLAEVEHTEYRQFLWLTADTSGYFIIDLGCEQSFNEILVRNCHNFNSHDRSTKEFR